MKTDPNRRMGVVSRWIASIVPFGKNGEGRSFGGGMRDSRGREYYQHYNRYGKPAGIRRVNAKRSAA